MLLHHIKIYNEKNMNSGDKFPTCISTEGPSHIKIFFAIPRSMRNYKIAFKLCNPKKFTPTVFSSSVEKQKGDHVENGSTGSREENNSGTCSTAQISSKSEDDDLTDKQSEEESTCQGTSSSQGQTSMYPLNE